MYDTILAIKTKPGTVFIEFHGKTHNVFLTKFIFLKKKNDIEQFLLVLVTNTHRERLMFHSVQYRNGWLAASDLFDMFTQSIKFYTFHYWYSWLKNVIHQTAIKNGWLLVSESFTAKFGLVCLNTGKRFFLEVSFSS